MKRILLVGSLFLFVFLVIYIVAKPRPSNLKIEFVNELETKEPVKFKACVLRKDGNLVLLDIEKKSDENIYLYALKIYDHYRNTLPSTYQTPLRGNFEVKKLEKKGTKLEIELEFLYLEENFKLFLTALMWTYQHLGIESVSIKAGRENFQLEKNEIINLEIEATSPEKAVEQVIYFYEDEAILPVTYIHQEDMTYFLIKKIIGRFPETSFTFETQAGILFVYILDPRYQITAATIDALAYNLDSLSIYNDIVIVKNGQLVYNN